jgi:menaquinone-dependent protoporphyrinogen oxidase
MKTSEPRRPRVLISAASRHGSTREIARVIGGTVADTGIDVDIIPPDAVDSLEDYDAVVLGSAVYTGHWLFPARDLVARFQDELAARSVWLFSSGPVGDPARKLVQSMKQDPAEIARISRYTHPRDHHVFAGRLDPQRLSLPQRTSLLVFRDMRGDFRDWAEIRQWADGIAADLTSARRREAQGGLPDRADAAAGDAGRHDADEQFPLTARPGLDARPHGRSTLSFGLHPVRRSLEQHAPCCGRKR